MLFLVFSDSHGQLQGMHRALALHPTCQNVLFLGDGLSDLPRLMDAHPQLHVRAVRGNMDLPTLKTAAYSEEDTFSLFGVTVTMMHGHRFGVKHGLDPAIGHAARQGARVLLYGHTHEPQEMYDAAAGLYVFNPGSIGRPPCGSDLSFGLLDILPTGDVMLSHGHLPRFS